MIEKEQIYIPCFHDMRTLHIYLPIDYETSKKNFPVLYMFDGHNLFFDEDATFGTSWGLKDYLDATSASLIVVGIECNHEGNKRLEEFTPYNFEDRNIGEVHAHGQELFEWIIKDLKNWIDKRYRTLPSRRHTGIGGSSMGGLMALYGILHHNDIFSKCACFSPFLSKLEEEILLECEHGLHKDTHIYFSWGSDEFRSKNQFARASVLLLKINRMLSKKEINFYPNIIFKGQHNEESWKRELPVCIPFLFHNAIHK